MPSKKKSPSIKKSKDKPTKTLKPKLKPKSTRKSKSKSKSQPQSRSRTTKPQKNELTELIELYHWAHQTIEPNKK